MTDDEILAYVVSANLRRRHLSEGQKAMASLAVERIEADLARARQRAGVKPKGDLPVNLPEGRRGGEARERAAKAFGVSGSSVQHAKKVVAADPYLAA